MERKERMLAQKATSVGLSFVMFLATVGCRSEVGSPPSLATPPAPAGKPFPPEEGKDPGSIDEQLAAVRQVQEEWARRRPDCVIRDVNNELTALASGSITHTPRQLNPSLNQSDRENIASIRKTDSDVMRVVALDTQKLPTTKEKALALAGIYNKAAEIALHSAEPLQEGNEVRSELRYNGECLLAKSISLSAPITIEDLQQRTRQFVF